MPTTMSAVYQTEPMLKYLMRALMRRIDRSTLTRDRLRNLSTEVTEALLPLAIAHRNTVAFVTAFANRFSIHLPGGIYEDASGTQREAAPVYVLIPRVYTQHLALAEFKHARASERPDHACYRWDVACQAIDFDALRILLNDGPAAVTTFAFAPDDPSDDQLFIIPELPAPAPRHRYTAPIPKHTISPRAYTTVWEVVSPLAHGGDIKSGNVTLFRRERRIDSHTGEHVLVPLLSGNAVRGVWRDIAGTLLCRGVGLDPLDLPPRVAHTLFAGGTIDKGADGASVDLSLRRRLREMLPMWDVFGGVWEQQIMQGVLKMHDPVLICREMAWLLYRRLNPKTPEGEAISYEDFKASLPPVMDCTMLRFGTRHAHKDFDEADGIQMIWNVEMLIPGVKLAHSFQVSRLGDVSELSRSFIAYLLDDFRDQGIVGASSARGAGQVAFDPYLPGPKELALPSPDIYLEWLAPRRDEVRALLMGDVAAKPEGTTAKRGRGGKTKSTAAEPPPVEESA